MAIDIFSDPVLERISVRLERMDLTSEAVLKASGLPLDFFQKLQRGEVPVPRGQRLLRLAEALGTSVSYLVGLDPDVAPPNDNTGVSQSDKDTNAGCGHQSFHSLIFPSVITPTRGGRSPDNFTPRHKGSYV